ncbi:MAG TPA: serine hydrolase [Dehalococcoidia bacterium]|nr:serine hydrolase [Dehalococcoidia bacterium]
MPGWKRHRALSFLVAFFALTIAACSGDGESELQDEGQSPQQAQANVWPGDVWGVSTPEDQGMDAARLEDVASYCAKHNCGATVITRHGRIVWERYWLGWDENSTDNSWSMAKSITDALIGIAIKEGKIEGVGQSAADFIPEWRDTDKEEITLRNLLSMTSGLLWNEDYFEKSDVTMMITSDDQTGYAVNRPRFHDPGDDWYYSSGDTQLFSAIIRAATGMEAGQYAQEKLFGPIGIKGAWWDTDNAGNTMTYCCVHTTARNFARFGYLYLRNGRWNDKQVVPEGWVAESIKPSQWENPSYGYFWWLQDLPDAPKDTFLADGFQTKRIYVIPSLDIVAVRIGENDGDNWDDNAFLKPIVESVTAD